MKQFKSTSKKILALLISALMLVSTIPVSALMALAWDEGETVTVLVKDENGNAIEGATVKYKLDTGDAVIDKTTDASGSAALDQLEGAEKIEELTVTATHRENSVSGPYHLADVSEPIEVTLKAVDDVAPTVDSAEADPTVAENESIEIRGRVSDEALSGIDESGRVEKVYYKKAGEADEDAKLVETFDDAEYSFTLIPQNYEGDYVIYCVDQAGNRSKDVMVSVKMSYDAPFLPSEMQSASVSDQTPELWSVSGFVGTATYYNTEATVNLVFSKDGFDEDCLQLTVYKGESCAGQPLYDYVVWSETDTTKIATLTFADTDLYGVTATYTDQNGYVTSYRSKVISVEDTLDPVINVEFTADNNSVDPKGSGDPYEFYPKNGGTLRFTVTERYFSKSSVTASVTVDGVYSKNDSVWLANKINWTLVEGKEDTYACDFVFDGDEAEAVYSFELGVTDPSKSSGSLRANVIIDSTNPVVDMKFMVDGEEKTPIDVDGTATIYSQADKGILRIEVTERFFDTTEVTLNLNNETYDTTEGWSLKADNTYYKDIELTDEQCYAFVLEATDASGNGATGQSLNVYLDRSRPTVTEIQYSSSTPWYRGVLKALTFGAYNPSVTVTVTAEDAVSGVKTMEWAYYGTDRNGIPYNEEEPTETGTLENITYDAEKGTYQAEFTLDGEKSQYRGYIQVTAQDHADNTSTTFRDTENNILIVDTISPTITMGYELWYDIYNNEEAEVIKEAEVMLIVAEDNFLLEQKEDDGSYYLKDVEISYTKKVLIETSVDATSGEETAGEETPGDANSGEEIPGDETPGDETSGDETSGEETSADATSGEEIPGDETPGEENCVIIDKIDWEEGPNAVGGTFSLPYELGKEIEYVVEVTYKDPSGNKVSASSETIIVDGIAPVYNVTYQNKDNDSVELDGVSYYQDGRTMTVTVTDTGFKSQKATLRVNGKTVETTWTPNGLEYTTTYEFAKDGAYEVKFLYTDLAGVQSATYSQSFVIDETEPTTPTITYNTPVLQKVLNALSFGFYRSGVEVTIESEDVYLDKISYSYGDTKCTVKTSEKYPVTFTIDPDFVGTVTAKATDIAGNESASSDSGSADYKGNTVTLDKIVVDNTPPKLQITYNDMPPADYYSGKITANIVVTEANFYSEDVEVSVTRDGAAYPVTVSWSDNSVDVHTGTFTMADDGDYIVKVSYTDPSENATSYESNQLTIDTTDPVVSVTYSNNNPVNTMTGSDGKEREYFDKSRTATITVTEKNFDASGYAPTILATDVNGNAVNVNVASSGWTTKGNVHTLKLTFSDDANYTFAFDYADLAGNKARYAERRFTVDKTKPTCVGVSYSTNLFEKVIESLTFGYYNAKMTVTITAQDTISGVNGFTYSYLKTPNSSSVNTELVNETVTYAEHTPTATVSFEIPKLALDSDNQFNGTVQFTTYDRSANTSSVFEDTNTVIVVDSIAPTAQITYNDPAQTMDNISYYSGNITANIVVTEANFYSEDVVVSVTRDGAAYPVTVSWSDNSVDVHTGTFTMADDGDYIVNVSYTDRSTNTMTPYESNQLTIDTTDPMITISDLKHQKAYNDETIGFTLTVSDENIVASGIKPTLNAVVKNTNADGTFTYETVALDLGTPISSTQNGQTVFTYTVENLDVDGYYSLLCEATDKAGHTITVLNAENEAGPVTLDNGTMNFSVNREGSVFWIETVHTDAHTGESYDNALNGACVNASELTVKLHELNVDPVNENLEQATILTLNDGSASKDITLVEGTNYEKNTVKGDGGWYESIYTLDTANFKDGESYKDGVYSINIITYDKANNSNVNTSGETGTIRFTLDTTKPSIVSNLTNGQRINAAEYYVEFTISDANLDANTINVTLNGSKKAEAVEVEAIGGNEYKFLVSSGTHSVEISAADLADNVSDTYVIEKFTVSTNPIMLWYANTVLFWGTIGVAAALAALLIVFVVVKNKKKNA